MSPRAVSRTLDFRVLPSPSTSRTTVVNRLPAPGFRSASVSVSIFPCGHSPLIASPRSGRKIRQIKLWHLESPRLVEPVDLVVHLVACRICVLAGKLLAGNAWRARMSSPFCNDKILVGARCNFVMDLVVPYKIVGSRGDNEYRDRNVLQRTYGGIIARARINAIHRIGCSNRVCT